MALYPSILIASTQLAAAAASVGGPTTPNRWLIKRLVVTNIDTVARTFTIHRVPSAGSATASNKIVDALGLGPAGQPGHTMVVSECTDMILNSGDTLQALSDSANKVNLTASGFTFQ